MKKITTIVLLIGLSIGAAYAATAAKGVFSVSSTRKVQFANANSIYSASQLIQWEHLSDVTDEGWDVLTGDEWTYLLITRDGEGMSKNALGTVDGQKGLVILPDEWAETPSGAPAFHPVSEGVAYNKNEYTAEQWAVMAESGAIFLPCAGYGYNDPKDDNKYKEADTDDHGSYWAKDESSSTNAYCMRFNQAEIHDLNNAVKTNYYCVILVKTVLKIPELYEEHEAEDFEDDIEAARGSDCVFVHRTLVKDSTLYTLCLPFDVPNIDESPLVGAEIFEFKGGRVTGTTGNEILNLNMSRLQGKRLTQGVPYILRWAKTTPVDTIKVLRFENVENWDTDETAATDPGNATVKFHGVYPKAHIDGYDSQEEPQAHRNFFIGANNTLYWPDDAGGSGTWATHKMKGFRGYFYITPGGGPSPVSRYRNMPAVWNIEEETPTDLTNEGVKELKNERTKLFQDGQIVLIIDGVKYDMQGRKLKGER